MMLSTSDYFPILIKHLEQYVSLTENDREFIFSSVKPRRLLQKQFLVQQGDISKYETYVVSGCLRTFYVDTKGVDYTLSFSVENWWANDLDSFLNGKPSKWNIQAIEPSLLLQIEKSNLDLLYQKVPLIERYFRILHQNAYIAQTNRILNEISLTAAERYKSFLTAYPSTAQRIPLKYIASYLGVTPVFLSQIRKHKAGKL